MSTRRYEPFDVRSDLASFLPSLGSRPACAVMRNDNIIAAPGDACPSREDAGADRPAVAGIGTIAVTDLPMASQTRSHVGPWPTGLYVALALLFWGAVPVAGQQDRNGRFRHLSVEQGLSHEVVNAVLQDRQGLLWFGTQDGLNRYRRI